MSDALNYLVQARPEAMTHYFSFLKDAGKHLDPKTRALISVITKVDAQTERGLRQYLKRALKDGCSAIEIIDALLMAFPTLGLSKIIWATDVILAMNLPEFSPEAMQRAQLQWHDLGAVNTFVLHEVRHISIGANAVLVYRTADEWRVYDSRCPHQSTDIPELALQGDQLTCPKHEWAFNMQTGACVRKGNTPLKRYESRVEHDHLFVLC